MKQKSNEEIKNNENIVVEEIDTLEKVITSYEKTAAALGQKQSSNNQRFNEKFEALCCLLFWIILIKVFIDVCLKIGGLVGLISSM